MRLANQAGYNIKDQTIFLQFQNKAYPSHKKNSVASWNSQGNLIATAQNTLKIWSFDPAVGLQIAAEARSSDTINQVKFYHQNLLATSSRQILKFWDIRQTIKPMRTQKKNKPDILTMAWNHDMNIPYFTILSKDNTISIYDLRNMANLNQPLYTDKNKNDINAIQWDASGSVIFCGGGDSSSSVFMMYTNTLQLITEITSPHNSKINSIAIDLNNQYIATCSDDSNVLISSLPDIICERMYSHTDCVINKVAFSNKSEYLAVTCQQPKLQSTSNKGQQVKVTVQQPCIDFYNVKSGGHAHRIRCGAVQQVLQWHPKKPILAYFDFDNEDKKKPGSQREQRYLHIFGV